MIEFMTGSILEADTQVIVNAANTSLNGGGGVDNAIRRVAGWCLYNELRHKTCEVGEVVASQGYDTGFAAILHTVGPVWTDGSRDESTLLYKCYENALLECARLGFRSITFPCISTGVYKFPKVFAARIAIKAITNNPVVDRVVLCGFTEEDTKYLTTAYADWSIRNSQDD